MKEYLHNYDCNLHVWVNGEWNEDYRAIDQSVTKQSGERDGFYGAFLRCLKESDADRIIFTSDEDIIPEKAVKVITRMDWTGISTMRGSAVLQEDVKIGNHFYIANNGRLTKGKEALMSYSLYNNYLPGTTYNMDILREYIPLLESYEGKKHKWYPHLFFDIIACITGDVAIVQIPTVEIGKGADDGFEPSQYNTQYSFGSRLDHHVILKDAIVYLLNEFDMFDMDLYKDLYYRLCDRTMTLVTKVNAPQYIQAGLNVKDLEKCATVFFQACVRGNDDSTNPSVD